MMRVIGLLGVMLAACVMRGQTAGELFEKAPPHVDAALRERVNIFYQAHVDGKFRVADSVVHEDSKEAFFGSKKEQIRGFEIVRINYSENFTKASVVVAVDTDFLMPMVGKQRVKIPLPTRWKLENGQWWWYLPSADEGVETPFGIMKPGAESQEEVLSKLGSMPNADAIRRQVMVSKTEVVLSSVDPSTDEVLISNGMPGDVTLKFTAAPMTGLEVKLDHTRVAAHQQAKLQFHYKPQDKLAKSPLQGSLRILPTQHVIPIRITFSLPPELQKLAPNQKPAPTK